MRERVIVLSADPELGARLAPGRLAAAGPASVASVAVVGHGAWEPDEELRRTRGGYGLLVLDGLLVRRLRLCNHSGAELLGPGDLLGHADQEHDEGASLASTASWEAIETTRLARLDAAWARRMAGYPEIADALAHRALERPSRLAATMAIAQHRNLEDRLWRLFWHFAERFGRVHPDGVHVQLPLTHELLAQLALSRRPSVSLALGRLAASGRVRRRGTAWILGGDPPPELS